MPEFIRIEYDEIREGTEDAELIVIDGEAHWIPKTQVSSIYYKKNAIYMTEWIAVKKGLV